ncbi:radical SAM protein [Xanthomonas sp. CFBP 8445]|uniref:radical SAM protein n=1 Tax=Xanthomonas sp. CFBP 8445 TaxID=2971236 RepID=UPI0021DFEDB4|nr:radical SAM protein [Xanthomonas sp. CFBP 8445]UYC11741.1 radical SAM protein [Xanthomonas sp. CFBP 8445]
MLSEATIAEALSPRILSLILLPTEKCNFRCTYCYEDFAIGRMHPSVVSGIKALIANRAPHLDRLNISWFGGEPLLARDVVLEIGQHANAVCAQHDVAFSAGFTTNGYLLEPALLQRFTELQHREFQITLDGDAEWHDRTRITASKGATFEKIWSNLIAYRALAARFSISLRLHLHQDNIESVRRLYASLRRELLDDPRFSVYFHKVSNLSAGSTIGEKVLPRDRYPDAIAHITAATDLPSKDARPISEEHLDGYICYAAKPNSLMIRANGKIGKCTVALNDDRNDLGRLHADGTIDIENDKLRRWMSGFSDLSEQTLGCPLSTLAST